MSAKLTDEAITDAIRQLADETEQIPTKRMWKRWDGRPCGLTIVRHHCGSWNEALDEAGLPRNPLGATTATVRAALYRQYIEMEDFE